MQKKSVLLQIRARVALAKTYLYMIKTRYIHTNQCEWLERMWEKKVLLQATSLSVDISDNGPVANKGDDWSMNIYDMYMTCCYPQMRFHIHVVVNIKPL